MPAARLDLQAMAGGFEAVLLVHRPDLPDELGRKGLSNEATFQPDSWVLTRGDVSPSQDPPYRLLVEVVEGSVP